MKTALLFIFALVVGLSVSAQQASKFTAVNNTRKASLNLNRIEPASGISSYTPSYTPRTSKSANAVAKVFMGGSVNAFTLLVQEQNCMYYNKQVDAIMGTYRGNNVGTAGVLATGNDICTYWSADHGDSFTGKISFVGTLAKRNRYPSGVIYNPAGNTNINNAFSLVAGPVTNGAGWINTYLSSVQYDGNNLGFDYLTTSADGELVRQGLSVLPSGKAHICTNRYAADYKTSRGYIANGTFNNNTFVFDWDSSYVNLPYNIAPDGTLDGDFGYANMAWSPDGSVGYLMYSGVDSRSTTSKGYYPILFKSVDQGASWQLMDYFDFSIFPVVFDHIWSTLANPNKAVPFFKEADLVVDGAGNPHIFGVCAGQYSQHPDSLGYTFLYEVPSVFEFSFEHGEWFCHYITHLNTRDVSAENSPFVTAPPPNVGWDMRLQASRTDDGSKVFGVWTDTDWAFWSLNDSINLYPDVMMWGRDVNTNYNTPVKNVTFLEEGMGEAYFMFVSPIAMDNAGVYDVPLSIEDINTNGLNADLPVFHYYLKGATLTDADFIILGGDKATRASNFSVTNYPNPFSGKTNIDISLEKSANVSIVVNSLTGQQVSSINYGTMGTGSHTLTFDGSNLAMGVYFYTVTIGDQKVTNKMVIK